MQEALASCGDGGSDPPDSPPPSSQFPRRPPISLESYNRFVQSQCLDPENINPVELSSPMDIDPIIEDAPPGIPPPLGDAIIPPFRSSFVFELDLCSTEQ